LALGLILRDFDWLCFDTKDDDDDDDDEEEEEELLTLSNVFV
jgi:hypothetical protein